MSALNTEDRLAARLAELRLQRGWSLDELALATGISRASFVALSAPRPALPPLCLIACAWPTV